MAETLRERCERRLAALKGIRQDYEPEWREIARFAQPARSRWLGSVASEKNKGSQRRQRNNKLLDPHGIEAFRTLTNGMTSGLTSASRPWFTLSLEDDDLAQTPEARAWLSESERRMYSFLARTNFYGAAKSGYAEMGLFGTEACVMVEHRLEGAVCHALTAGEYWIACSDALTPDTLYRTIPMTVRQMVQSFGKAVHPRITHDYDKSNCDQVIEVFHGIEPNADHEGGKFGSKPWRSVYWDSTDDRAEKNTLSEQGYHEQPFWATRWDVTGGDDYGVSPGMEALPALRELQMQAKRRNEAIDAMVWPEKVVPPSLRLTGEPRRVVTGTGVTAEQIIVPYQMPYQGIEAIRLEMDKVREQIDGLSFADLFNAITNMRGVQPRNVEEIASRNEEKLTQLGPVIERVANEKLEIAIDRTFGIMMRGGLLPEPPQEIAGQEIKVEFVSVLTQMQRMVGIGQIERTVGFVGNLAGVMPDAVDKIDVDELIDEYGYRAGAPAKIIRSTEQANKLREARAQQAQAAQMAEMAPALQQGADAARLLSETRVGGAPILDTLVGA